MKPDKASWKYLSCLMPLMYMSEAQKIARKSRRSVANSRTLGSIYICFSALTARNLHISHIIINFAGLL